MPVRAGKNVVLHSGFDPKYKRPTYVVWTRKDHHRDDTLIGIMQRDTDSSDWKPIVANNSKYAINSDGDLILKRVDKTFNGEYKQSTQNVVYIGYHVRVGELDPRGTYYSNSYDIQLCMSIRRRKLKSLREWIIHD